MIAGSPSRVAGILMYRLGRSTSHHRALASARVRGVSCADARVDLDRDAPVHGVALVVDRPQHVAGPAHVVRRQGPHGLLEVHLRDGRGRGPARRTRRRQPGPSGRSTGWSSRPRRACPAPGRRGCPSAGARGTGRRARPRLQRRTGRRAGRSCWLLSRVRVTAGSLPSLRVSSGSVAGGRAAGLAEGGQARVGGGDRAVGGEAELLVEHGVRRGGAEVLEGDAARRARRAGATRTARCRLRSTTRARTSGGSTVVR